MRIAPHGIKAGRLNSVPRRLVLILLPEQPQAGSISAPALPHGGRRMIPLPHSPHRGPHWQHLCLLSGCPATWFTHCLHLSDSPPAAAQVLAELPLLRQVSFKGCPLASLPNYRERMAALVPRLEVLDNQRIVNRSRKHAAAAAAAAAAAEGGAPGGEAMAAGREAGAKPMATGQQRHEQRGERRRDGQQEELPTDPQNEAGVKRRHAEEPPRQQQTAAVAQHGQRQERVRQRSQQQAQQQHRGQDGQQEERAKKRKPLDAHSDEQVGPAAAGVKTEQACKVHQKGRQEAARSSEAPHKHAAAPAEPGQQQQACSEGEEQQKKKRTRRSSKRSKGSEGEAEGAGEPAAAAAGGKPAKQPRVAAPGGGSDDDDVADAAELLRSKPAKQQRDPRKTGGWAVPERACVAHLQTRSVPCVRHCALDWVALLERLC